MEALYHLKGMKPRVLSGGAYVTEIFYLDGTPADARLYVEGERVMMGVKDSARDSPSSIARFLNRRLGTRSVAVPEGH